MTESDEKLRDYAVKAKFSAYEMSTLEDFWKKRDAYFTNTSFDNKITLKLAWQEAMETLKLHVYNHHLPVQEFHRLMVLLESDWYDFEETLEKEKRERRT